MGWGFVDIEGFESRWRACSSEPRSEDIVLAGFGGGDAGACCVLHCAANWGALVVVTAAALVFASLLFWIAIFRRLDRLGFVVN